ncbi:hypothetical protein [Hymenobacter algoricola]
MKKASSCFLLAAGLLLGSCQTTPPAADQSAAGAPTVSETPAAVSAAPSADQARAAVASYVRSLPNAALYQLDSARVREAGPQWQVLVPRTDWARRLPNKAAFNVDKQTGAVSNQLVK